jgi:hypothetical protein
MKKPSVAPYPSKYVQRLLVTRWMRARIRKAKPAHLFMSGAALDRITLRKCNV